MPPHIDERRRGDPGRRRMVMVGDAQRHAARLERGEHLIVVPGGIAELDHVPAAARQQREKVGQPRQVRRHLGRQLEEAGPQLVAERRHGRIDPPQGLLRLLQPLHVRQEPRGLPGEEESLRRGFPPARDGRLGGQPVEGSVDLGGREPPGVEVEPARLRQVLGIERAAPGLVDPARRTDPNLFHRPQPPVGSAQAPPSVDTTALARPRSGPCACRVGP